MCPDDSSNSEYATRKKPRASPRAGAPSRYLPPLTLITPSQTNSKGSKEPRKFVPRVIIPTRDISALTGEMRGDFRKEKRPGSQYNPVKHIVNVVLRDSQVPLGDKWMAVVKDTL